MNDLHVSSGAYALNALDDLERARCDAHLAECPECRTEVASFLDTAARLASTTEQAPPAELRARILSEISQVRPLPPLDAGKHRGVPEMTSVAVAPATSGIPDNVVPIGRRQWLPRLVAAAAVVLALGAGAVVWHPWQNATSELAGSPITQVLNAKDRTKDVKHLAIGGEATIFRSASVGRAVMSVRDLPTPPAGKAYELWYQRPSGNMVPAGMIANNEQTLLDGDATTAVGAGITLEPAAGSKTPTLPPVALFVFGPTP